MRVGLISDTHGPLRPEALVRLSGVDHVLHAGDVGPVSVLMDLSTLAPVSAVWGNTDGWDVRARTSETLEIELGGLAFAVAHGHTVTRFEDLVDLHPGAAVVVHGHSHVPRCARVGDAWLVNPGSAGPGGDGWAPSVAVADVSDGSVRVVHYDLTDGHVLFP